MPYPWTSCVNDTREPCYYLYLDLYSVYVMYSFCPNALLLGPYGLPISFVLLGFCPLSQLTLKFAHSKSKQCYARLGLQYHLLCWPIFQRVLPDLQQPGHYDILLGGVPGKYGGLVRLHGSLLLIVGVYVETVRECCLLMSPHEEAEKTFLLWRRRSLNELVSQSGVRLFLWWWEYNFSHLEHTSWGNLETAKWYFCFWLLMPLISHSVPNCAKNNAGSCLQYCRYLLRSPLIASVLSSIIYLKKDMDKGENSPTTKGQVKNICKQVHPSSC